MILCHMAGHSLAGWLFCFRRQGQTTLSGIPLMGASVWTAQEGLIPKSGDMKWMLEAWAQLVLLRKAPGWLDCLHSSPGLLRQHDHRDFSGSDPRSPRISHSPHYVGQSFLSCQPWFKKMKVRVPLFIEGISKNTGLSLIYPQRLMFLFQ